MAFRMVYISSDKFYMPLKNFAVSDPDGLGLILLDGQAAATYCPILTMAAYRFSSNKPVVVEKVHPAGELLEQYSEKKQISSKAHPPPQSGTLSSQSQQPATAAKQRQSVPGTIRKRLAGLFLRLRCQDTLGPHFHMGS